MRFDLKFEYRSESSSVKMIPLIPDQRICRIEGHNGVGKSLAIKLIELACGRQPFDLEELAWASLKQQVSHFEIIVTHFKGGEALQWHSQTDEWPEMPEEPREPWIGTYELDGRRIPLDSVRSLLSVSRVVGDETIIQTIGAEMQRDVRPLDIYRDQVRTQANAIGVEIQQIKDRLTKLDPDSLLITREKLTAVRSTMKETQNLHSEAEKHFASASEGDEKLNLLARLKQSEPELTENIENLSHQINVLKASGELVEEQRRSIHAAAEGEDKIAKEVDAIFQRLEDNERERSRIQTDIEVMLKQVGDTIDQQNISTKLNGHNRRIRELNTQKDKNDRVPALRDLVKELNLILARGDQKGLGAESLYAETAEHVATVRSVHIRLEERFKELVELPPAEETVRLSNEINQINVMIANLKSLDALYAERKTVEITIKRWKTTLKGHLKRLEASVRENFDILTKQAESITRERDEAINKRAQALGQLAALQKLGRREDLEAQLLQLEAVLGNSDRTTWTNIQIQARKDRDRTEQLLYEQSRSEKELSVAESRLKIALDDYGAEVAKGARWLLPALGLANDGSGDPVSLQSRLNDVRSKLDRIETSVQSVLSAPLALSGLLKELAPLYRNYSGGKPPLEKLPDGRKYLSPALDFYGTQFAKFFDSVDIREALFEGGNLKRLDLKRLSIEWINGQGVLQARPLEAFSSGERAFAYILTQLNSMSRDSAQNRVVALDEFGAFMARDRFERLIAFLEHEILGKTAEQIIVILPVAQNYAEIASEATGEAAQRAKDIDEQLRLRGYHTRDEFQGSV